ncbi:MAG: YidC/Oxa1 family membrane protein insertase [Chloroflexota bacterium]|nr:membrane protein insertase YidC [Anaerolineales bacterium]MCB8966422.1 membrane protein insertase YidC [Ardenticatenaceae bacterium]
MWDTFILNPMVNGLLLLYDLLGNNFILAIAVFTVLIRAVTLPLNMRQQRSSMRMQEMQPQIQAIQKKYRDNPQKMQEEFQKIGYNPAESLAGCLPLLIQFPVLIGLYQAITTVLGATPQALFGLTQRVYSSIDLTQLLPIENKFLWLNMAQPDPWLVLPILVFATMFLQQKLLTPPTPKDKSAQDNPAAQMTQSMQYTMPIMFGFFSLQFPAGLSIYFVLSNLIGIAQGYYMRQTMPPAPAKPTPIKSEVEVAEKKSEPKSGKSGSDQKKSSTAGKRRSAKR